MDLAADGRNHECTAGQVMLLPKSVDGDSGFRRKHGPAAETRISDLPDELIAAILSFLDAQEAARTCLVSRRWRCLWILALELQIGAKFVRRFLMDQMMWYSLRDATSCHLAHRNSLYSATISFSDSELHLNVKKMEAEVAKARLADYEKNEGETSIQEKKEMYGHVYTYVRKLAEVRREQEKVQAKSELLEVERMEAKTCYQELLDRLREFSAEKWVILTSNVDVWLLLMLDFQFEDKELYFSIGGCVQEDELQKMQISGECLGLEEPLKPGRLYLLQNKQFTTVSSERATELGFRTVSE